MVGEKDFKEKEEGKKMLDILIKRYHMFPC